jgi:hypothetical protein
MDTRDTSDHTDTSVMTLFRKYIILKADYFDKYVMLDTKSGERRPIHRVFDIKTNCPLHFREQDGAYIVEVIHPSCPDIVYYRYSINVNNYIDLTHLYEKHQKLLESMHVDEDRLHYLRKIEIYNQRKSKLLALQSIPAKNPAESIAGIPADLYREEMVQLETEIQELRDEFDEWLQRVKNILTEMDIIRDISVEKRQEKYDELNQAQIQYFHLWNQQHTRDIAREDAYRIKKSLYQDKTITAGSVVEYNDQWFVVVKGNDSDLSSPIRIKPLHSIHRETEVGEERQQEISVLPSEVKHHEGHYNKWKQFKFSDRIRVTREYWHEKLVMHGLEDTYGVIGESVKSEYPATPGKKPRQIMMEYILGDCSLDERSTADADVDVDTEAVSNDAKKEKKKSKKTKKAKVKVVEIEEEEEEESPEKVNEPTDDDATEDEIAIDSIGDDVIEVEEVKEAEGPIDDIDDISKKFSEIVIEETKNTSKGKVAPRGRLMIKIPTKSHRNASPSPVRYSPRHASQIAPRKSSLKRRDGDAYCVKPEEFKESQKQLYQKYLEMLYDDREQIMELINEELPEKTKIFEEDGYTSLDAFPAVKFSYIRGREERQMEDRDEDEEDDEELPEIISEPEMVSELLTEFENALRKVYSNSAFVETVLDEKGKRKKVLDTVSLYHHLIHDDIQCEWNPSPDDSDGEEGEDEEKKQVKPKKKRVAKKKKTEESE